MKHKTIILTHCIHRSCSLIGTDKLKRIGLLAVVLLFAMTTVNWTATSSEAQSMLTKDARIVFLGDSITQSGAKPGGYVSIVKEQIAANFPDSNIEVIGAGISGNKVPSLQKRLQKDVLDLKPTCVVIYIGINDVWHSQNGRGTPKEKYESGLNDIITKIQNAGSAVILCTPTVIGEKVQQANELDEMLDEYAAISRSVAKRHNVQLLDLREIFQDHLRSHNPLDRRINILTNDGVHLNKAGNDFLAEQMLQGLGYSKYRSKLARTTMQHIVLFKFKAETTEDQIAEISTAFAGLKDDVKEIIGYEAGTNVSPENLDKGFTHAFIVTFRDTAGRDKYLPHPAHKKFVELLSGKIEEVLVVDFESVQ